MLFLMLCLALDPALSNDAVVGTWKGYVYSGIVPYKATLELRSEDGKLKGTLQYDEVNEPPRTLQCKLKGDRLMFSTTKATTKIMPPRLFFDGDVTGDVYRGRFRFAGFSSKRDRSSSFIFKRVVSTTETASD